MNASNGHIGYLVWALKKIIVYYPAGGGQHLWQHNELALKGQKILILISILFFLENNNAFMVAGILCAVADEGTIKNSCKDLYPGFHRS